MATSQTSELLRRSSCTKGPGVQVAIFDAADELTRMTQYAFNIWREFRIYGTVEVEFGSDRKRE